MTTAPDRSYRALLTVPSMGRVLLSMQIARIAGTMLGVALVLFALTTYHSTLLAGFVTFASVVPGLLVSPIAGALLDRNGRTKLVVLDYLIAMASLVLVGGLAVLGALPAGLLLLIAAVASLTGPLSATGLRSLFPIIVPHHLWERVNAVDSNGFVLAMVVGPPLAAGMVSVLGGPVAIMAIGAIFGVAAVTMIRVPDPPPAIARSGSLIRDAWDGLLYTIHNPTLRALGVSISVLNLASGAITIVVPVLVLQRLGLGEFAVGAVFAVQGIAGMMAAFLIGRMDSRGRERPMLIVPMFIFAAAYALILIPGSIWTLVAALALAGVANGPLDIALFTLRQRRTDPAWTGRAFAVSMSINYLGSPIGSALAGWLVSSSVDVAIGLGVASSVLAGVLAFALVPGSDRAVAATRRS
jgi:MFS family permease